MKLLKLLVLLGIFVGCATTEPDLSPGGEAILHKANTIIIHSDKAGSELFRHAKQMALSKGFSFANVDTDSMSFSTDMVDAPGEDGMSVATRVKVSFFVQEEKDGSVGMLAGHTSFNGLSSGMNLNGMLVKVEHRGQKGSVIRNAWDKMYSFAKSLKGTDYKFEIRK